MLNNYGIQDAQNETFKKRRAAPTYILSAITYLPLILHGSSSLHVFPTRTVVMSKRREKRHGQIKVRTLKTWRVDGTGVDNGWRWRTYVGTDSVCQ
jgi:hypothetical protein